MRRRQREKDEELARAATEREAENARRALERKLQLQDKARRAGQLAPETAGSTGLQVAPQEALLLPAGPHLLTSPPTPRRHRPQVESVEESKRRDAYERAQALRRIQEETERSRALLEERRQLQDQRRLANLTAAMQRQQIVQARGAGGEGSIVALSAQCCSCPAHHLPTSVEVAG